MAKKKSRNKNARRGRSDSHQAKRREAYLDARHGSYLKGQQKLKSLRDIIALPVNYPGHFATGKKDGDLVTERVQEHWPTAPKDLPNITEDHNHTVLVSCRPWTPEEQKEQEEFFPGGVSKWLRDKVSDEERAALREDGAPPYLVMRFAHVIPSVVLELLLNDWDYLNSLGVLFPDADDRCSVTPALHLGVWGLYGPGPRITGDSLQKGLKAPELSLVTAAMDKICMHVKIHIVLKLEKLMAEYVPGHIRVQKMIYQAVRNFIGKELNERPALDFGGLFFTMAVKEGSSERVHIDWNDNLHKYALIFCAGDYVGGEFCMPQLNKRVPLLPGSIIAARTRLLAHCSAPVSGRRLVFTCFTDSTLLGLVLKGRKFTVVTKK